MSTTKGSNDPLNIKFIGNQFDKDKDAFSEIISYVKEKQIVGVDTETEGAFDHRNNVIMFQIGDHEKQFVIDTRVVDIDPLKEIMEDSSITKIFHNAKFDYKFILKSFGIDTRGIRDTFLGEKALYNGIEAGLKLKDLVYRYEGEEMPKEERGKFSKLNNAPFTESMIEYGANDVRLLTLINEKQRERLYKWNLESEVRLQNRFIRVLSLMEYNGFYLNPYKWREVVKQKETQLQDYKRQIEQWIIENGPEEYIDRNADLFDSGPKAITYVQGSSKKRMQYIFSSPKETAKFMHALGLDIRIKGSDGEFKDSVREDNLIRFYNVSSFIPLYLKLKKTEKAINTYGYNFLDNINKVTGRIHSEFFPMLNTGRISSNHPNLQNIPSEGNYRNCFTPQFDNTILCVSDLSQQEPRTLADISGDEKLINTYNEGGDTHSLVASIISEFSEGERIEVSKENNPVSKLFNVPIRDIGKKINLSLAYGKSAYTLKDDLGISQEEAQKVIDKVYGGLPQLGEYFERVKNFALKHGYVIIDQVSRRKYFIPGFKEFKELEKKINTPGFWDDYRSNKARGEIPDDMKETVKNYFKKKGDIERLSRNYPIQGTSGSMTKYAAILLQDRLEERNMDHKAKIVNMVHDEIVVECDRSISNEIKELTEKSLIDAGRTFCKKVPMKTETELGTVWQH